MMPQKIALCVVLAMTGSSAFAQSLSTPMLTTTPISEVAYINQVGGGASARIAPLSASASGFSSLRMAAGNPGGPGGMPMVPVAASVPNDDTALQASEIWANQYMQGYASQVGGWLRGKGVGMAYYTFAQPIVVNAMYGGPRPKKISLLASIDSAGHASWGVPKVVDDHPLVVEMEYVSKSGTSGSGNDPGWQHPNPGRLRWRVVDENNSPYGPMGQWTELPAGFGKFDPPNTISQIDPLGKLPCLADRRNSGCDQSLVDGRALMSQTGASFARILYVRPVEPAYIDAGDGTLMPQGAIVTSSRRASCTSLTEKGQYQFQLDNNADQYLVRPAWTLYRMEQIGQVSQLGVSPIANYAVTISQNDVWPWGQDQPTPWAQVVASPVPTTDMKAWAYDDAKRVGLIQYQAPLQTTEDLTKCPRNRSRDAIDPVTGWRIDPATGWPVDPATGLPVDPAGMLEVP